MSTIIIGRGSRSHLQVEHDSISRLHATVRMVSDDLIEVVDEQSANGTFLLEGNTWRRIERGVLRPRGQLKLGAIVFSFEDLVKRLAQLRSLPDAGEQPNRAVPQPLLRPRRNPLTGQIEEDRSFVTIKKKHP